MQEDQAEHRSPKTLQELIRFINVSRSFFETSLGQQIGRQNLIVLCITKMR